MREKVEPARREQRGTHNFMSSKKAGGVDKPAAPKGGGTSVDVLGANGVIRTYSIKVHGKDFKKHAEEFASKVEGRKVVAHKSAKAEDEDVGTGEEA